MKAVEELFKDGGLSEEVEIKIFDFRGETALDLVN